MELVETVSSLKEFNEELLSIIKKEGLLAKYK